MTMLMYDVDDDYDPLLVMNTTYVVLKDVDESDDQNKASKMVRVEENECFFFFFLHHLLQLALHDREPAVRAYLGHRWWHKMHNRLRVCGTQMQRLLSRTPTSKKQKKVKHLTRF